MNTNGRQLWIDNIKLIACVAVFWGHFYSSFYGQLKGMSWLNYSDTCIVFVMQHILNILFNGGWWVFAFCLISGWLAWRKNINTIEDLAKALLHRYIRFVIPVFIANCFVVVIGKTIGFHSYEVGISIGNDWLAGNYSTPPQASHILKSALLLNNEFVGPLWVLQYIFVGSCAIYCLKYLFYKLHVDNTSACLGILALWPVAYYTLSRYGSSWFYAVVVVEGALLSLAGNMADHEKTHKELVPIIGIAIIAAALNVWSFDNLWNCITAMLFLWFSIQSSRWQRLLESNSKLNKIGRLSFTVYLLHCPLLYSVSMLIYQALINSGLSYSATVIINLIVSTIVVIAVSEIYYILIQKRIDLLIKRF